MNPDPNQEYADAIQGEAAAWEQARSRLPGSGYFDATLWQAWRSALRRTDQAREAVLGQTSTVRLTAAEVMRPGHYRYTDAEGAVAQMVRVLRTPTLALVRFPEPRGDVPLAELPGIFVGPMRR